MIKADGLCLIEPVHGIWNLVFPVFISPIVWNMCENLDYESVYFQELRNEQEYYRLTIRRVGAAVVSTITSTFIALIPAPCFPTHFALHLYITTRNIVLIADM